MNKPKRFLLWGLGVAAVAGLLISPNTTTGQAPGDEQAMAQLIAEIAAQQAKLAENQQVIDQKIATIEENMRLARIFVSRGGGTAPQK